MIRIVLTKFAFLGCLCGSLLLVSCSNDDSVINGMGNDEDQQQVSEGNEFSPIELSQTQELLSQKCLNFSENFFKIMNHQLESENLVFSPLSCQSCLSMLANACSGKAHDQILEVLGYQEFSLNEINAYNALLASELNKRDKTVQIESTNGFFQLPQMASKVKKNFKELLTGSYHADIITSDNLASSINDWVKDKTNGQISSLYDTQNEDFTDAILGIVNALYFKGQWSFPFDKESSFVGKFHCSENSSKEVEYLVGRIYAFVYDFGTARSIGLQFGNGSFNLEIILPKEDVKINELIDNLDLSKRQKLYITNVDCTIPKFSLNTVFKLEEVLMSLGMEEIFVVGKTDFSPMLDLKDQSRLSLGDFRQGCGISIDEQGVTASTGTSGLIYDTCTGEEPVKIEFTVNRPFLFLVKEISTNTFLLMGKVENP